MIPTRRLVALPIWLAVGMLPYGLLPVTWQPYHLALGGLLVSAAIIAAGFDALFVKDALQIRATRTVPQNVSVLAWTPVTLAFDHTFSRPRLLEVFDHYPPECDGRGLPTTLLLYPGDRTLVTYDIQPRERGDGRFTTTEIRLWSRFRFWYYRANLECADTIRIYPDFASIHQYILFTTDNQLGQLGIKKLRRRGEGTEFHQLREYREGDSQRQIDWKATARRRQLISREYEEERDQQLVLMLDCSRRMRSKDGPLSHFDHALNAMLLLAYVALKQGDAVGVLCFGGSEDLWLAPRKGVHQVNNLLNAVYGLQPSERTSDYIAAVQTVMARQQRRCLAVLASNFREEHADDILDALRLLQRRHLLLLANLRDSFLDGYDREVRNLDDAMEYLAVTHYVQQRRRITDWFRAKGIAAMDSSPEKLSLDLVNRYQALKRHARI